MSTSTSYPKFYSTTTHSSQQHQALISQLTWRQTTSMPVVKVLNFSTQMVKQNETTSTVFNIEVEHMVKSVTELRNLDIAQAAYIIREVLIGIQTLSVKFNCQFDTFSGFYGINEKGQTKVWFSEHLFSHYTGAPRSMMSFSVRKVQTVVDNLFQLFRPIVKLNQQQTLSDIGNWLHREESITFTDVQNKFRNVCSQYRIVLVNNISLQPESSRREVDKKQRQLQILQGRKLPIRLTRQPLIGTHQSIETYRHLATKQIQCKQKINWRYLNSNSNKAKLLSQSPSPAPYQTNIHNSISSKNKMTSSNKNTNSKKIFFCRSVPTKLEGNSQQRKNISNLDEVIIKEFNPVEEEDSLMEENAHVVNTSNVLTIKSVQTAESKNQRDSKLSYQSSFVFESFNAKKSYATTRAGDISARGKSSVQDFKDKYSNLNKLEEMIDNTKSVVDSIMVPSPEQSRKIPIPNSYNFGGLLPIDTESDMQIDGKEVESMEASIDEGLKKEEKQVNSKIDFDLLGGINLMAALESKELKESVWCGEEKKAQHLQVKLLKLGNFGREISASFVPFE